MALQEMADSSRNGYTAVRNWQESLRRARFKANTEFLGSAHDTLFTLKNMHQLSWSRIPNGLISGVLSEQNAKHFCGTMSGRSSLPRSLDPGTKDVRQQGHRSLRWRRRGSPRHLPPYTSEVEARSRRAPTRFASPTESRDMI